MEIAENCRREEMEKADARHPMRTIEAIAKHARTFKWVRMENEIESEKKKTRMEEIPMDERKSEE